MQDHAPIAGQILDFADAHSSARDRRTIIRTSWGPIRTATPGIFGSQGQRQEKRLKARNAFLVFRNLYRLRKAEENGNGGGEFLSQQAASLICLKLSVTLITA